MDRLVPSMDFACRGGLPSYPEPVEKMIKDLIDMPYHMLTPEELDLVDAWVQARVEPIRAIKEKNPNSPTAVFAAMRWPSRIRKDHRS